jgi:membrane protein YqaA with SNARE-associated domain
VALLSIIGFGIVSALFPLANAEAYVIVSQVSHLIPPALGAAAVAVGQTIGKTLLFLGTRSGRALVRSRHHRPTRSARPPGRLRAWMQRIIKQLLDLLGKERWGLPIVLLAAVVGVPPLYAVALLAGATTMRTAHFVITVLVGRTVRFVLLALGADWLVPWSLP